MTRRLVFRPEAEADVVEAFSWYAERGQVLGEEFLGSLDASLASIQRLPESYPVVHRNVRRALLRRFPYGIFYALKTDAVVVLACFHASRDPKRWQSR